MKNVRELRNVLYKARKAGLYIETPKRTITLCREDLESGKYNRFTDKLKEAGFVVQINDFAPKDSRVMVYRHKSASESVYNSMVSACKKSGVHVARDCARGLIDAITMITSCQRIIFMHGWEDDPDARLLLELAKRINISVTLN